MIDIKKQAAEILFKTASMFEKNPESWTTGELVDSHAHDALSFCSIGGMVIHAKPSILNTLGLELETYGHVSDQDHKDFLKNQRETDEYKAFELAASALATELGNDRNSIEGFEDSVYKHSPALRTILHYNDSVVSGLKRMTYAMRRAAEKLAF